MGVASDLMDYVREMKSELRERKALGTIILMTILAHVGQHLGVLDYWAILKLQRVTNLTMARTKVFWRSHTRIQRKSLFRVRIPIN
jgi:hypothetical protein